jgi:hypothetical protein
LASALLIAFAALCATTTAAAQTPAGQYETLLALAKSGEDVDWQALRFAYATSPAFDPTGVRLEDARHKMAQDFAAENYAAALADARRILASDWVDVDAHMISDFADQKLGRAADARREHEITVGLLQSIETGDGQSEASALTVISTAEEHSMMRVLGYDVHDRTLVEDGGHAYDKLEGTDAGGVTKSFYFQIDRIQAAEQRAGRR